MPNIEMGKQYRTRYGREVEIITTSGRGEQPVLGYIGAEENIVWWNVDGCYWHDGDPSGNDLIEIKPKRTVSGWVNVYPFGTSVIYDDKETADNFAGPKRTACKQITFEVEEGEGLEGLVR